MYLSKEEFLSHFPLIEMSKDDFAKKFTVMYACEQSLKDIFDLVKPDKKNKTPIIKNPATDKRYLNRDRVIDYFYEIIITNRHRYLTFFYEAYFEFKDPRTLSWDDKHEMLTYPEHFSPHGVISLQKNDSSRRLIRNLFYLELLDKTKVTNTVKSQVSFWTSLTNMYNKFQLEDRFFAPSSIDLFLREKKSIKSRKLGAEELNYNNLFYLFQAYQPKASIFNPYSICWILKNVISKELKRPGKSLFTPVLSWGSYLPAFMHSSFDEYLGVDVMETVCKKVNFMANYYKDFGSPYNSKKVHIMCCKSESLLYNKEFLAKWDSHFDAILLCPPYFDMEVYSEGEQSIISYPNYEDWLIGYWKATVEMCFNVLSKGGIFAMIANDYNTLQGETRKITVDFKKITEEFFEPVEIFYLQNRTSPLRANIKDRTERLFVYRKF